MSEATRSFAPAESRYPELYGKETEEKAARGRAMLVDGKVSSAAFHDIDMGDNLWTSGDADNRMWQWTLHSFNPLDNLFAIGALDEIVALVTDWEDRFAKRPVEDDFPWHDHATALRLDRISRLALERGEPVFADLAARHADLLLEEEFFERHTNHGYDQAVSLVLAAAAFPDSTRAAVWLEVGVERLKEEIRFAFTEEGVHVENSPAYHAGMFRNLDRARRICALAGVEIDIFDEQLLQGAVDFLAWATRPDRYLCYIGDTVRMRPNVPDIAEKAAAYPALLWAATAGAEGEPIEEQARVFEKSGYAFYRSTWRDWSDQVHLAIKSSFLTRYHRQDDDLNVLLYAYGEDWLVDSGLYNHNQRDPVRLYMRSALAHNVPVIEDCEASRSRIGHASLRAVASDNPFDVEATTQVYVRHRLTRRATVDTSGSIHLRDRISGPESSVLRWLFHVPRDKKVTVSKGKARIMGKKKSLYIRTAAGPMLDAKISRGFDKEFPSVMSQQANVLEDTQVIVFGPSKTRDIRFVLSFEDN